MPILRRIKIAIDFLWAKYIVLRVAFVIAFLVFIIVVPILTISILHKYNPIYPFIFTVALVVIPFVVLRVPLWPTSRYIKRGLIFLGIMILGDGIMTHWCYTRGDLVGAATFIFLSIVGLVWFIGGLYNFLKIRR